MYEIKHASEENYIAIRDFLKAIPNVDIDDKILSNASILFDEEDVSGIISYEAFYNYALIRYFVFKREVNSDVVKELFSAVLDSVNQENIEYVFSLVNQEDIYDLFSSLDFNEISKENVFIEEECYTHSKFKDTKLMIRKVN